jgi:alginate O-acetyltransferase complex protein AlgI
MLSWTFAAALVVLALCGRLLPPRGRRLALPVASIGAVALVWAVPVVPLLAVTLAVYALGRVLPRLDARVRSGVLTLVIATIVAVLALAKLGTGATATLAAPTRIVGLSYFALKFVQHLVDAAAGRAAAVDPLAFVGLVFFPPTYAAGPIERSVDFARAAPQAVPTWGDGALGIERVVFGLGKKFLLADPLLAFADPAFQSPGSVARSSLLLATYAYALGLYLDFAGYSDIAIGAARCLGVRVRENFDRPYLSRDLATLWQRWHMSFTGWLRDFVFIPVTRRVLRRTRRPLFSQVAGQTVTMLICGLWHGVDWHFTAWGAYHAVGLSTLAVWRAIRRARRKARSGARRAGDARDVPLLRLRPDPLRVRSPRARVSSRVVSSASSAEPRAPGDLARGATPRERGRGRRCCRRDDSSR